MSDIDLDADFDHFLAVQEAASVDEQDNIVAFDLSDQPIYSHDVACACPSSVRPKPLAVEDMFSAITGVRRSPKVERCKVFISDYLRPRHLQGKQFHCLSYSYLMRRFEWSRNEVRTTLELLRVHDLVEIVYPAMSDLKRAPIYKVSDRYVHHELRCRSCGDFFPEVLETACDRLAQRQSLA